MLFNAIFLFVFVSLLRLGAAQTPTPTSSGQQFVQVVNGVFMLGDQQVYHFWDVVHY
jgi:hypothetical protein